MFKEYESSLRGCLREQAYAWRNWVKAQLLFVELAGVVVDIWTQVLPHTKKEWQPFDRNVPWGKKNV
jgi:hypothetical protein